MKFRKKPVVIEAEQWLPCRTQDGEYTQEMPYPPAPHHVLKRRLWVWGGWQIRTPDGWVNIAPYDWIVCGVRDDWYPCKNDIFKATYDPVADHVP